MAFAGRQGLNLCCRIAEHTRNSSLQIHPWPTIYSFLPFPLMRSRLCHRPPSRVLWFFLGAMTATYWMARKHRDHAFAKSHCKRPPPDSFFLPSTLSAQQNPDNYTWPRSFCDIPRAINNLPPAPSPLHPDTRGPIPELDEKRMATLAEQQQEWEQEKAHFAKVVRQATDTFIDLSESVLSKVASATECWRAKLAQQRIAREKEQRLSKEKLDATPTTPIS